MSRCCMILNNMLKKITSNDGVQVTWILWINKKSFYCPRAMRLMTLIRLVKLFVFWTLTHYVPVVSSIKSNLKKIHISAIPTHKYQ
jgi:hypothetical protein